MDLNRQDQDLPSATLNHRLILEDGRSIFSFSHEMSEGFAVCDDTRIRKVSARSNDAFISRQPTKPEVDSIQTLDFSIHGAEEMLADWEFERGVALEPALLDHQIFSVKIEKFELILSRHYSFGPSKVPLFGDYRARFEFEEPVTRKTALEAIVRLRSCLSFFAGSYVTTSNFIVQVLSNATGQEREPQILEWFNGLSDDRHEPFHAAPLLMLRLREDHETFARNLRNWFKVSNKWDKFFVGHLRTLAYGKVVSRDLLLDLCRWIEDHPEAIERDAIDRDEIEILIDLIQKNLSNPQTIDRAVSAISFLKKEGNRAFFTRLLEECPQSLTANGKIVQGLVLAKKLRGTHAHSNHDNVDFWELEGCVSALETLCSWLLPHDLEAGVFSRASSTFHPICSYANFISAKRE